MLKGPRIERDGLVLRLLRPRDEREWLELRAANRAWLKPWEASLPPGTSDASTSFRGSVRRERNAWASRRALPLVIESEGRLVGRVSLARIEWGPERGASLGYWVSEHVAGRGIAPRAVAMLTEFAFDQGFHRIEISIRPENAASLAVVRKLGLREEGLRESYLFIDGDWRDHRVFAITASEPRIGPWWRVPKDGTGI